MKKEELLPGIFQWSVRNEEKKLNFNGLLIESDGRWIAVDPPKPNDDDAEKIDAHLFPSRDFGFIREGGTPNPSPPSRLKAILLTSGHHVRWSADLQMRTGAPIYIHPADVGMLESNVLAYDIRDFWGGADLLSIPIFNSKTPGETALFLQTREKGVLILGDALIGKPSGKLSLLPAEKFPRGPKAAREGIKSLLDYLDAHGHQFDAVLVGDGESIPTGGRRAVEECLSATI